MRDRLDFGVDHHFQPFFSYMDIMITRLIGRREPSRALATLRLEGKVTSISGSSQGEVEDNREKWGDFWEKLIQ